MLTLYDFGNSVCCQKVRITMRAKGLVWEAIKVDLFRTEQYDPNYLKLNPKGVVPTLVHDGKPIIESTALVAGENCQIMPAGSCGDGNVGKSRRVAAATRQ